MCTTNQVGKPYGKEYSGNKDMDGSITLQVVRL
jgi:hypothetical protein